MTNLIAIDLGNESGRVMSVRFDGQRISSAEVYRFLNQPVTARGTLYWDVFRLWHEIELGLEKALAAPAAGIAVDSFGVDFGLLDARGSLISNPVHMRDGRTSGMMEWVDARIPRLTLYERTGIGFYVINTLYQLAAISQYAPWQLDAAQTLLTMPNLISYWLTGERVSEFTHSTTTMCYNPSAADWDWATLDTLGIPRHIFPTVVQPGARIGQYQEVPVFAAASHDTASAVAAVPAETENFAYISSGTWSLLGLETRQPVLTEAAMQANITNEGGAYGTFRPLNLVMGLWIVQQCRAAWNESGQPVDYSVLIAQAEAAPPFLAMIDPDDASFFPPGDMPSRVQAFCARTGQAIPQTPGEITRVVLESLALKYRTTLERQIAATGRTVDVLHIVGGGAQNAMLCQMTADATGRPVLSGPVEATTLGNGLVQLIALGEIRDLAEARRVVRESHPPTRYVPHDTARWDEAYARFEKQVKVES